MTKTGTVQGGWYLVQPGSRFRFDRSSKAPAAVAHKPTRIRQNPIERNHRRLSRVR